MLNWFVENIGTIFILCLLIGVVLLIILKIKNDKKQGKCTCGGSCEQCPIGSSCHHN